MEPFISSVTNGELVSLEAMAEHYSEIKKHFIPILTPYPTTRKAREERHAERINAYE
jgi:hypothetical protein